MGALSEESIPVTRDINDLNTFILVLSAFTTRIPILASVLTV